MQHIFSEIVDSPIDSTGYPSARSGKSGAEIEFFGIVRDTEHGERIEGLDYETFREMAEHQLFMLASKYLESFGLEEIVCIHRVGFVPVGEPSLYIRVSSTHRPEALRAVADLIDELKRVVPIWKHPVFAERRLESTHSANQVQSI